MTQAEPSTNLREYRLEMSPRISQEVVAHRANITLQTYRKAEAGENVSYTTARAILAALNQLRREKRLKTVELDALNLSIV